MKLLVMPEVYCADCMCKLEISPVGNGELLRFFHPVVFLTERTLCPSGGEEFFRKISDFTFKEKDFPVPEIKEGFSFGSTSIPVQSPFTKMP